MALFRGLRTKPSTPAEGRPSRVGTAAPPLEEGGIGDRAVLLFMTSSCSPCRQVWKALAELADTTGIVVVTPSSSTESRRTIEALLPAGVRLVMSSRAWFDYGAGPAPWMAAVRDGRIEAEGPAPLSSEGLLQLIS